MEELIIAVNQGHGRRPTRKKRCGAKTKGGNPCQRWAINGRERCQKHGGTAARGPESVHFRHGQAMRGPGKQRIQWPGLDQLYEQALHDSDLARFKGDMALLEAMKRQLTGRLNADRAIPQRAQVRLIAILDLLGKTKDRENKRLRDLQLIVSVERHVNALRLVGEIQNVQLTQLADELRAYALRAGVSPEDAAKVFNAIDWQLRFKRAVAAAAFKQPALIIDVGKDEDDEK